MNIFRLSKEGSAALKKYNSAKSAMWATESHYKELAGAEAAAFALENFGLQVGDKVNSRQSGKRAGRPRDALWRTAD